MKLKEWIDDPKFSQKTIKAAMLLVTFTVALIYIVFHLEQAGSFLSTLFSLFSPFLLGIAVAFVLNVLLKLFEDRIFGFLKRKNSKIWRKCGRGICVLFSFIAVFLILGGIIFFVVPELANSIQILTAAIPSYVVTFTNWLNEVLTKFDLDQLKETVMQIDWTSFLTQASQVTTDLVGSVATATMGVASGVLTFVMSLIFAVYMLFSKEKLIKNLKRVLYAFLPPKRAQKVISVGSLASNIFSGFVTGQVTEALILGCLCYLGMSIIRLPYALLISVIVSLTSLIPILGAYLGGAIGAFILLIIDPLYCLWFLIFLVILQQVEGNLIYPRVVGTSIGLPGIWVLLAILVCGNLWGIPGILMGVPLFSVVYTLLRTATRDFLQKKGITDLQVEKNSLAAPADASLDTEEP